MWAATRPAGRLEPRRLSVGRIIGLTALVAVILSLPFWGDPGITFRVTLLFINVLFATSFNLLFGYAGMVSFGQAAYFAAGAYTAALLMQSVPSLPLAFVVGVVVSGMIALVLGYVLLRTSGIYFAILSLALGQVVYQIIYRLPITGGINGLTGIKRLSVDIGGFTWNLQPLNHYYYFILLVAGLGVTLLWVIAHSRFGRALQAIREDPVRAGALGIHVKLYQLVAFVIVGALTGLAGAMYGPLTGVLMPELATWVYSTTPILIALLGGAQYFWGPAVGAVFFGIFEYLTRTMTAMSNLAMGLLLLAVVMGFPGGIMGLVARVASRARTGDRAPRTSHQAPFVEETDKGESDE